MNVDGQIPITCPYCLHTSHHPEDASQGYCGACHEFTREKRKTELGALAIRVLEDGRELSAIGQIYNWRLCIGPAGEQYVDDFYCYSSAADCVAAVIAWDGTGDPPGCWHRHGASGRRREFRWVEGKRRLEREWIQA